MKKYLLVIFSLLCLGLGTGKAQYNDLFNFNEVNGYNPQGSLIISGNVLFGMAYLTTSGYGNIFSIHTDGTGFKVLHVFNGTDGGSPDGSLILSNGVLYGMASLGGAYYNGTLFSIDTNGTGFSLLHSFSSATGEDPGGSLTLIGNKLYGMATNGGAHGNGVIFSIQTNGSGYKDIFDFNTYNGAHPSGDLTFYGNKFYGMAGNGGAHGYGIIFSVDTNGGNLKDLYDFNMTYGAYPHADLTLSGKKMYGMTNQGGAGGSGVVFSIDTNGSSYKDLLDFNSCSTPYGAQPNSSLILSGSRLYGMTFVGGKYCYGCIFSVDTNGTAYRYLFNFSQTNTDPFGGLILSGNFLYGMTTYGGTGNDGAVFLDTIIAVKGIVVSNVSCFSGNSGSASAYVRWGDPPYTYSWNPGGATTSTASGLTAGNYTVTVTDNNHFTATTSVTITQPTLLAITMASHTNVACNGGKGTAIANAATGGISPYTYLWSPNGGTTLTASNLSAGTYIITATDNHGCTATAGVIITQPPSLRDSVSTYTCIAHLTTASVGVKYGTAPYTYLWSPGGGTKATMNGLLNGTYTVKVTDKNGCTATTSKAFHCSVAPPPHGPPAGDSTQPDCCPTIDLVKVYPNPSKGVLTFSITNYELGITNVEIYNVLGQRVLSEILRCTQDDNLIKLSGQPNGIYFYRVVKEDGKLLGEGKLIIEK